MFPQFWRSAKCGEVTVQFQSGVIYGHGIWTSVSGKLHECTFLHAEATQDGQPARSILLAGPYLLI